MKSSIMLAKICNSVFSDSITVHTFTCLFFLLIAQAFVILFLKRQYAKKILERNGLPTVFWIPRFMNFRVAEEEDDENGDDKITTRVRRKLASSTITRILPRMERLKGPYGMYGTIYGVSTAVVHVAHPIPARKILLSTASSEAVAAKGSSGGKNSAESGNFLYRNYLKVVNKMQQQQRKRRSIAAASICNSSGISKAPAYNHFKDFCGDGVFTANDKEWKEKRTSVIHSLFRSPSLPSSSSSESTTKRYPQNFENQIELETHRAANAVIDEVQRCFETNSNSNEKNNGSSTSCSAKLNIVPLLQRTTIGIIYRYITHEEVDFVAIPDHHTNNSNNNNKYRSALNQNLDKQKKNEDNISEKKLHNIQRLISVYLKSVVNIRMIILANSRSFWFLLPRWFYRSFSSMYREEERTLVPIRKFARIACQNAKPGSPLALLKMRPSHNKRMNKKNVEISKDLLDEAITLLFAGQDTSAATLSWTLHLLSLHPEKQAKLAEEIQRVLREAYGEEISISSKDNGAKKPATRLQQDRFLSSDGVPILTKSVLSKMIYLDAVIKESMRLFPVAPFIVRKLPYSIALSSNETEQTFLNNLSPKQTQKNHATAIPAGSLACIWIYGLHRNPTFWNQPDDFVPERWIEPSLRDIGSTCGAYMPFAAGPRNCLGRPLAHIILRGLLARIVHKFEFYDQKAFVSSNGGKDIKNPKSFYKDMQVGFTVLPRNGVALNFHQREYK